MIEQREQELRETKHTHRGTVFIDQKRHSNEAATLISWKRSRGDSEYELYRFETFFRAGTRTVSYIGDVSQGRITTALARREALSRKWRQFAAEEIPTGIGFVAGDVILADNELNNESWKMLIKLKDKPDAWFELSSYIIGTVEPGLRERAGGVVAGLLGTVAGFSRLRNRQRPVGPIDADEILLAGTQDGKRGYGFKWEAPGKVDSLAEPNLNVSLEVGESAYTTNKESFASDEEALEVWDAVVESIRLRPGAV